MPKTRIVPGSSDREVQMLSLKNKYKDLYEPPKIEAVTPDQVLPTPSMKLNDICGEDMGIRQGSIVHYYGAKGTLKTTTALEMCREAQYKWPDKIVAFIDTECRVDLYQASEQQGINLTPFEGGVPRMVYRRPESAEDAWELARDLAISGQFSIVVMDSIASMRGRAEIANDEVALGQVGLGARINSAALKKIAPVFPETGTILWLINQERIVQMQPIVLKGPSGGAAPGYYATHEFQAYRIQREDNEVETTLKIRSEKMKYALGFRTIEIPVTLGRGINQEADLIEFAIDRGVVVKSGSWYKYNGENLAQGLVNTANLLRSNSDLLQTIRGAALL